MGRIQSKKRDALERLALCRISRLEGVVNSTAAPEGEPDMRTRIEEIADEASVQIALEAVKHSDSNYKHQIGRDIILAAIQAGVAFEQARVVALIEADIAEYQYWAKKCIDANQDEEFDKHVAAEVALVNVLAGVRKG